MWRRHSKLFITGQGVTGPHIKMEQTRVSGGIWMPERVEVRATAKIFFVKTIVIDRILIYSEYTLPQVGVPSTRESLIR
jgi:hypothetical protein